MLGSVLGSFVLLLIAAALSSLLRKRLLDTIFLSAVLITAVLYVFAIVGPPGSLPAGVVAVSVLGLLSLVYLAFVALKQKTRLFAAGLPEGLMVYAIFFAMAMILNRRSLFVFWDEFSHWGIIIKHMYTTGSLGTAGGSLTFPAYPPGISLFEYFFVRLSPVFDERLAYIALDMLYIIPWLPFYRDVLNKDKTAYNLLLTVLIILLPMQATSYAYGNLSVDQIMGVMIACSAVGCLMFTKDDLAYGMWYTASALFLLTLSKPSGFALAILVMVVIWGLLNKSNMNAQCE